MFSTEIHQLRAGSHLYFNTSENIFKTHDRFDALTSPFDLQKKIQIAAENILQKMHTAPIYQKKDFTELADAFILRYASNPLAKKTLQSLIERLLHFVK